MAQVLSVTHLLTCRIKWLCPDPTVHALSAMMCYSLSREFSHRLFNARSYITSRGEAVPACPRSAARIPRACVARNRFQVGSARRGAGSIPASCRICHLHTVSWAALLTCGSGGRQRCREKGRTATHTPTDTPGKGGHRADAPGKRPTAYPSCTTEAKIRPCAQTRPWTPVHEGGTTDRHVTWLSLRF
jgi:hypothetical protein